MMTILRTTCPSCDVVRVRAEDARIRREAGRTDLDVSFACPSCDGAVVQQLPLHMFAMLVTAGCVIEPVDPSDVEGAISEDEIREFVDALDRADWAEELAY